MTKWIVQEHVPYEGYSEEYFNSAEEVVKFLLHVSKDRRWNITIYPQPISCYEPHEFEKAFNEGLVE